MKRLSFRRIRTLSISLVLLVMPAAIFAQPQANPPPVAPELVREGDFAVNLAPALGLGTITDEVEAETKLGEAGITPRNGWIADYPVTPDIVGELQQSVAAAADAGKISMRKDEALRNLENVIAGFDLTIKPHTTGTSYEALPEDAEKYPNPTAINNYYVDEGPPVVTYYAPPPDYYYLYAWVPYPFWWYGFWFPGFFVLHDFHRPIFIGNRWCFVSNHFNDFRAHRVFRIDPVGRFNGRTFAGIGVSGKKGFIPTGVPRSERRIFNAPRPRSPEGRTPAPPPRSGRKYNAPIKGTAPSGTGGMEPSRGGGGAFGGGGRR